MVSKASSPEGSEQLSPYFADIVAGRRGQLLDAALTVFVSKGYDAGTMREVAAALGVSEPALYRYYESKEALYSDLVATAGGSIVETVGRQMMAVDPDRLRSSLIQLFASGPRRQRHNIVRILITAAPHQPVLLETFKTRLVRPMFTAARGLVVRIDAHHGIPASAEQTDLRARMFMSLFVGYFMTGLMLELPDDDSVLVDAMLRTMGWSPGL